MSPAPEFLVTPSLHVNYTKKDTLTLVIFSGKLHKKEH